MKTRYTRFTVKGTAGLPLIKGKELIDIMLGSGLGSVLWLRIGLIGEMSSRNVVHSLLIFLGEMGRGCQGN